MGHSPQQRLTLHLRSWLGRWPAAVPVDVVGSTRRVRPGWDGRIFPLLGVGTDDHGVISVRPDWAGRLRGRVEQAVRAGTTWPFLVPRLAAMLNRPDQHIYNGVFRWCERPAALPDAGAWVDAGDPRVPEWLRPFGHEVLIVWDEQTGAYLAGVGLKHHDRYGREIAVGTDPAARGRGLARRLVAQAARRVLDEGTVPTYQHDPANVASARVAEAAGFPDRGWRSVGLP
jgi:RimJ/RimL family protein N-acetyltransferase